MIHPTAVVEKGAELGQRVTVGAFAYVGANVRLGDDCEVHPRATILGHTAAGDGCVFFPCCVVGNIPQDLKYRGERCETIIGSDNHFREMVTVHSGTGVGGGVTRIGDHNRFFVAVHIAHDNTIGNHIIIANNSQLAGHCHIEDCVTMGGMAALHHFVTVGRYAMVAGFARVTGDAVPYMTTMGYQAAPRSVNFAGSKRWRVPEEEVASLAKAYKCLYGKAASREAPFARRLQNLESSRGPSDCVQYLCEFIHRTESGRHGRYLESKRTDNPQDNRAFYEKKMVGETTS